MRVRLEYGRNGLEVELPDKHVVKCLGCRPTEPLPDPTSAIQARLREPIGSKPLAELARGPRDACLVISDVTRPVPNAVVLPPILDTLRQSGIPPDKILILVATGMHRPNLGDELKEMVGPAVFENYRIQNHHGSELSEHVHLGTTPRGVPAWIDGRYLKADLKITTGLIEPHFMAGFSGGRKVICPGLAAFETIKVWHSPQFLEHPNARAGCLRGNPVHEENTRIARMAGCHFIVNVVIDAKRRILQVVAGDMEQAFQQGAEFVRQPFTDTLPEPVDVVVTSSAGYPLDTTYYQSVKGMVAALPILKPGGTIVLAAGMSDGIGSRQFQRLFDEHGSPQEFMQRILNTDYFVMDQWQLEELARVLRSAKVKVVTDGLPAETLRRLFVQPAESVEAAVAEAVAEHGRGTTIAVIPEGPYVMAELASAGSG